ncbi:uncharacterized protein LOC133667674 [Apis cerana]|uniref:uncharacterized protein LOC133667674 n=1 Tax=Apis cerana TaxID=7461 RepID=UPI002B2355E4|nr:uncharacterized protein LOC133667674 [Apis cerana]
MTSRCDSNPAQYERNRRFGHLVHALGRAAGGAKLPSSKTATISLGVSCGSKGSKQCDTTRWPALVTGHRTGPSLPYGRLWIRRRDLADRRPWRSNGRSWVLQLRRRDSESSVDDLGTWRGVVLGRAVTTLRSVETQPYAWGFVLAYCGSADITLGYASA